MCAAFLLKRVCEREAYCERRCAHPRSARCGPAHSGARRLGPSPLVTPDQYMLPPRIFLPGSQASLPPSCSSLLDVAVGFNQYEPSRGVGQSMPETITINNIQGDAPRGNRAPREGNRADLSGAPKQRLHQKIRNLERPDSNSPRRRWGAAAPTSRSTRGGTCGLGSSRRRRPAASATPGRRAARGRALLRRHPRPNAGGQMPGASRAEGTAHHLLAHFSSV